MINRERIKALKELIRMTEDLIKLYEGMEDEKAEGQKSEDSLEGSL